MRRAVNRALEDPGGPLPRELGVAASRALAFDFSRVRIHDRAGAAEGASLLGARAFTWGDHIAFGAARFEPGSPDGRALIAHELTHVAQNRGADPGEPTRVADDGAPAERQARSHALGAQPGTLAAAQPGTIFRDRDPTRSALYPTQQERTDVQAIVNPQHAAAPSGQVAAVTDPVAFHDAMRDRIVGYIDRVLPGAQAFQNAPTTLGAGDLTSLGQVGQTQATRFFGDYARQLPATFQLSQHLHFVPDTPPAATLTAGVRDWTASRMRAIGGDLLEQYHVLTNESGPAGRDQTLFNDTRRDIIALRATALETIIRYAAGYEQLGEAYIQPHLPAQSGESAQATLRLGRWRALGTTLHEMMHQLAHPDFRRAVSGLEESGIGVEGFAEYFAGEVYEDLQQRSSSDAPLKAQIEGGPPPPDITPPDRVPGTYARYVDGVNHIKQILGGNEDSLRVAYFMGRVEFLGLGGWTGAEAARRRFPGNIISTAALLDFSGQGGGFRVRYGRIVYGRAGALQIDLGAGLTYLHSSAVPSMGATPAAPATDRLGVSSDVALRYSWPNVYLGASVGVGASAAVGAPFADSIRLDVIPGFEAGVVIGRFRINANLQVLAPVGGPVPERTVRALGGIGASVVF